MARSLAVAFVIATLAATMGLSVRTDSPLFFQQRQPQLLEPQLPATPFIYNDDALGIPRTRTCSLPQLERVTTSAAVELNEARAGNVSRRAADNTPAHNEITDAGATLGRVLFYDTRLSKNNTTSCGSCHLQEFGFTDTAQLSLGHTGLRTIRHSMALTNARYFSSGRFFWDERAASLEDAVLLPIQDTIEMGMTLDALVPKLRNTKFYPPLFTSAFGTPEVTTDKISRALAQFIRSMVSVPPEEEPTPDRSAGRALFVRSCTFCHSPPPFLSIDRAHNNGLDSVVIDKGVGEGRFKAPSLRNIALRGRFMHDGRFKSLEEVVDFYNAGIKPSSNLDVFFRRGGSTSVGGAMRMGMTDSQKASLIAFLRSFTDEKLISDPRFSDPFSRKK